MRRFQKYSKIPLVLVCLILMYLSFEYGKRSITTHKAVYEHLKMDERTLDRVFMSNMEIVSWSPRAQVYHNFLTKEECETIMALAEPHLERSTVVNSEGKIFTDPARSSSGYWILNSHPVVEKASKQIEDWTRLPAVNGEAFYVLRYEKGEQYKYHVDFFAGDYLKKSGRNSNAGNRIATVLVYLQSPEEGGETQFIGGTSVQARQGTALLFWDYGTNFEPDTASQHAGKPVIKGVKWSMTRWIRMNQFGDYYQ